MRNPPSRPILAGLLALMLASCSSLPKLGDVAKDHEAEYKTSRSLPPLEVPPDLSSSSLEDSMSVPDVGAGGTATFSELNAERPRARAEQAVLVNPEGIRVARDGNKRWLVLDGPPSRYWNRVREFWLQNGLLLKVENPSIGIMETDWAENRADIPQGWLRRTLGGLLDSLYSTATRDKFRVRFERGVTPGTTELYLTHRGAEEVVQGDTTVWQPRPADPELEAEMLNRLMVFLGVQEDKAERMLAHSGPRPVRAQLTRDAEGHAYLTLNDDYGRAWRRTGLALDRVGFTVEDRDRSRGLYFVRYVDPKEDNQKEGLLSKLKFWGNDKKSRTGEYLVSLVGQGERTLVRILSKEGRPDYGETAGRILALLHEQLK